VVNVTLPKAGARRTEFTTDTNGKITGKIETEE
jgi:hypothetical protein